MGRKPDAKESRTVDSRAILSHSLPVTYTWTGADLTSLGATETGGAGTGTITFTVGFTQTGGSGITNVSGKVSVTGGNNDRIDGAETLTATIALTSISGHTGIDLSDLTIGFTYAQLLNFGTTTADITTASGTVTSNSPAFAASSFFTVDPAASGGTATLNAYTIQLTAVPEPTAALLGGLGLLAMLRRRR